MNSRELDKLIRRHTREELSGFDDLYDQYQGLVRSVVFRICGQAELNDVVQDVFLKLWKALPQFRGESSLKTWIYRVTMHAAFDRMKRKRIDTHAKGFDETQAAHGGRPPEPMEIREIVDKCMRQLSDEHRRVIILGCYEELSVAEMASVLNIPEGTVKSRLHNAKLKLAEAMERQGVRVYEQQ